MAGTWARQRVLLREHLREMRERQGLTQVALAQLLGKQQSYVSKVESGERRVDFVEVREICRYCGANFMQFVERFDKAAGRIR